MGVGWVLEADTWGGRARCERVGGTWRHRAARLEPDSTHLLTNLRRPIDVSESGTASVQQVAASAVDQTRPSTFPLTHGAASCSSETATGRTMAGLPSRAAVARTRAGAPNLAAAASPDRTQIPAAASARVVFAVS